MTDREIVEEFAAGLGGRENIISLANCMTRLRVIVAKENKVREDDLRNIQKVLAVIHDGPGSYEVVVGPGNSRKMADIYHEKENAPQRERMDTGKKSVRDILKVISDIFVPMIPGIIAAGLCGGFASMIEQLVLKEQEIAALVLLCRLLRMIQISFMSYIMAWTGYRAAECYGATPILGGMLGMITSLEYINEVAMQLGLYDESNPLCSILHSGKGGVLSVICSVFILSVVEKFIRKRMPANLDIIFTPFLSLLICIIPHILIVMPAIGYVSNGIVWVLNQTCLSGNIFVRMLVGYAAAALFLPLAASGMHHGLVGLYTIQLQEVGYVTLYPALAMAGAGQVGAALAIYKKAKRVHHQKLCSVIGGALPAGILGVGEPLIYGVTLPMGRPFLTAGLGAGFGGAFVMACQVASTAWGASGILGVFVMTAGKGGAAWSMTAYMIGLAISYVMGYLITALRISDAETAQALGGITQQQREDFNASAGSEETSDAPENIHRIVKHGEKIESDHAIYVFTHIIKDPVGIHARPAGELAKLAAEYDVEIRIQNGERSTSAKSVTGLMLLDAGEGSRLQVTVTGKDARKAGAALQRFLTQEL